MDINNPLSCFISSKMEELEKERRAVKEALKEINIFGWIWEDEVGALSQPTRSAYLSEVATCDLYIGLFWLGYGPYTIEEFEHAHKIKQKDCLIYEKNIDTHKRDSELMSFLNGIRDVNNPKGLTICSFSTPEQLQEYIKRDITKLLFKAYRERLSQKAQPLEQRKYALFSSVSEVDKNVVDNTVNDSSTQNNKLSLSDVWWQFFKERVI